MGEKYGINMGFHMGLINPQLDVLLVFLNPTNVRKFYIHELKPIEFSKLFAPTNLAIPSSDDILRFPTHNQPGYWDGMGGSIA